MVAGPSFALNGNSDLTHQVSVERFGLTFHHFGVAVRNPESALKFLTGLGYEISDSGVDPEQRVAYVFCTHKTSPMIEVLSPAREKSPIDRLINKHMDGIIYHPCWLTDDLGATLEAIEASGLHYHCVSPAKPGVAFGGRNVSFYQISGIGLVEIVG